MIINVKYITETDVGVFESNAQLDTFNGKVINIENSEEEGQDNIEQVFSEKIRFNFYDIDYEMNVEFTDSDYEVTDYKNSDFKKILDIVLLNENVEKNLEDKTSQTKRMKV